MAHLSRLDVIVSCCVAFFSWIFLTNFYPDLRFAPYAFAGGFLTAVSGFLYLLIAVSRGIHHEDHNLSSASTYLAFSSAQTWTAEIQALDERSQYRRIRVYQASTDISNRIDSIINLILRDFLQSWYVKISNGETFINEVDRVVRIAAQNILDKVLGQDLVEIAVTRILPTLNNHITSFSEAERLVRGKNLNLDITDTEELDIAIAAKYRDGKVHPAVSLAASKTATLQQQHMRRLMGRLVMEVLPASMTTSTSVLVLLREMIACAVLVPALQMLADPDVINQLIEAYGRSVLYERKTVRKLREALDQHATPAKSSTQSSVFPRLSSNDSERSFEKFIRKIRECDSLSDARRFRSEILRQLKRDTAVSAQNQTYLRRLEIGRKLIDQRVAQLSVGPNRRLSQSESSKDKVSNAAPGFSRRENASLRDVLYDASGLSYFMEFMDRLHIMAFVQFWVVVDGMRNPLEQDLAKTDSVRTWSQSDRQDILQISQAYLSKPEINISSVSKTAVRQFIEAGDGGTWRQYVAARQAILSAQEDIYADMKTHFLAFKRSDLYYKWLSTDTSTPGLHANGVLPDHDSRRSSPTGSRPISPRTETVSPSIAKLKQHEFRRAVASSSDLPNTAKESDSIFEPRRSLDDNAARPPLFEDDYDTDPLAHSTQSLESDVESRSRNDGEQNRIVAAVQAALDDIVDEEQQPDRDSLFSSSNANTPVDLGSPPISFDFSRSGNVSPNANKDKPSLASLGLVGTPSRRTVFSEGDLFGENEKLWEDGETTEKHEDPEEDDIREAAPGDLGLAELVQSLSLNIEKLETQQSVVEALTGKAELTNNAAELRILRKSRASLEREIHRKELQRQQYIVQQSENDLYGRASISIKKIMIGSEEDGHEFALYVIEVQRQAREKAHAVTWAIARRYSEFHDLHKRLRARYPSVRDLDFPRRQIVFTLQKDFLRKRRAALEKYLRELLTRPSICRSLELRAFLSQQAIRPISDSDSRQVDRQDFVTRIYNSVTDGMEEFPGNMPVLDQLSLAGQNLITAATALPTTQAQGSLAAIPSSIANDPSTAAEAEAEITAVETTRYPETTTFIQPICDTFLELFQLNQGNNWLRGRAVVVVLQQLLGGTIERKVRESFKSLTTEDSMLKYLDLIRDSLWPGGGKFRPSPPPRTESEKARSRREAGLVLATLLPDLAGGVVGRGNAAKAGRRIFATLNNERLNQHLVYTVLDEVVESVRGGLRVTK